MVNEPKSSSWVKEYEMDYTSHSATLFDFSHVNLRLTNRNLHLKNQKRVHTYMRCNRAVVFSSMNLQIDCVGRINL